jgi:excisionase family DNA binding protein
MDREKIRKDRESHIDRATHEALTSDLAKVCFHNMSEPTAILGDALRAEIKEIVREVIREELANSSNGNSVEKDTLLTPEQAAALMGVTPRWLYRHRKLPFVRPIGRKTLRFSQAALNRWLAARKTDSRR